MDRFWQFIGWRPANGTLLGAPLVLLGILLSGVHEGFLVLAAIGTFGPGILREMGILNDQDEFQRIAARKAGYHAFLTAGLLSFFLVAFYRAQSTAQEDAGVVLELFLIILWFT